MGPNIYVEPTNPDPLNVAHDYPLDPWGNPYFIVSEEGIVDPDGYLTNNQLDHSFDRLTILSLGADGSADIDGEDIAITNPNGEDDIWVHFGASGLSIKPETYY